MKRMKGDVTTHMSVVGLSALVLEKKLGFKPGRLSPGYEVWELREDVLVGDFVWGDQTLYSGGWQYQNSIDEYARRFDILRAEFGKKFKYDESRTDLELKLSLGREATKINVRQGPSRIVKIRPKIGHDNDMFWLTQYPNSRIHGTPQWTIVKPKLFEKTSNVDKGAIYN